MTEEKRNQKQAYSAEKIFPVPSALEEIKENITINTNTPSKPSKEQIINQAFKLHSQGNISEAAKHYQYLINQGLNDYRVFYNYGVIMNKIGNIKEAEICQHKAIKINPYFAESHNNLGNIFRQIGKLKEAEISYRKAIKIKPDYALAHSNLGVILRNLGKLKDAENSYSNAILLKPDDTYIIMNRSQLFFDKGEFDLALKDADSCNTKFSRAFSLEILFAQGRIDEIYERIEKNSKLDELNIKIAALSSFLTEQENKITANNFCRNPLSFLFFSNLKFHHKDYDVFIKKIINELAEIKTIWEPLKKSTHNGFQTPTNINLFSNSSENISYLKSIILNELDCYYLKFEKENCSYIQKWPSKRNLTAWHVILKKQGYQDAHIHPSGWLSGVIYLKVVPSLGKDEGAIEFSLNGGNYSNTNSPKLIHQPQVGDIVLFPSSLHHRTIPFSTDTDRIVIAFDLMPN